MLLPWITGCSPLQFMLAETRLHIEPQTHSSQVIMAVWASIHLPTKVTMSDCRSTLSNIYGRRHAELLTDNFLGEHSAFPKRFYTMKSKMRGAEGHWSKDFQISTPQTLNCCELDRNIQVLPTFTRLLHLRSIYIIEQLGLVLDINDKSTGFQLVWPCVKKYVRVKLSVIKVSKRNYESE